MRIRRIRDSRCRRRNAFKRACRDKHNKARAAMMASRCELTLTIEEDEDIDDTLSISEIETLAKGGGKGGLQWLRDGKFLEAEEENEQFGEYTLAGA